MIIAIGLLFGLTIAIFFANRHSKPIRSLIMKFDDIFSPESEQDFNERVGRLCARFNKRADIQVIFGMGTLYGNLLDIFLSYKEAINALELVNVSVREYILRYDELPGGDGGYYYPLEIEQLLINLVKSGNEAETICLNIFIMGSQRIVWLPPI